MWVCHLWKDGLDSCESVEHSQGRSEALRDQRVRTEKWHKSIFKLHVIFEIYLGAACWKIGQPDLESQANSRNGIENELLTLVTYSEVTLSRVTAIHIIFHYS